MLGRDYAKALKVQRLIKEDYAHVLQDVDVLVMPVAHTLGKRHVLIPVRQENPRPRAINEHWHNRLREMLNAGRARGHRMIPPQAKVAVGWD